MEQGRQQKTKNRDVISDRTHHLHVPLYARRVIVGRLKRVEFVEDCVLPLFISDLRPNLFA
jgi:hypothetical protein